MITISSECSTQWFMPFFHIWIVVIASAVIVLLWWKKERRKKVKRNNLPVLATCRSGTSAMLASKWTVLLPMEALDNALYGSWRLLTNLALTFRACHSYTFNVAAIFFRVIPTYGVLLYAMIVNSKARFHQFSHRLYTSTLHVYY